MSALARSTAGAPPPVRALPSSLAHRSAPTIPPASSTYEPLAKSVLKTRLLRTFTLSAVVVWGLVVVWTNWISGGVSTLGLVGVLLTPVSPGTLFGALGVWASTVVPVVVLRKAYLTVSSASASSPSKIFNVAINKKSTSRALLTYTSSAALITLIHVLMSYAYETTQDPRLTLFVKSRKHPYYLNGRLLYIVSSQITLAVLYLLRNVMMDRFAVRWSAAFGIGSSQEIPVLGRIAKSTFGTILLTGLATAAHTLVFGATRSLVLPVLYKLPILPRLLRPFSAHFLRGSWGLVLLLKSVPLIWRAFMLGTLTTMCWEVAESLFDTFIAEPVNVSQNTADPPLTVVSGLTSNDHFIKHFAYAELRRLAKEESEAGTARRSALFADQKFNPSLWSTLSRDALKTLGEDYQLLLRRGAPAPPAPASAPAPRKVGVPPQVSKTPLVRASILRPVHQSPIKSALETFAADGTITHAVSSTASATTSQLPELFRSVISDQQRETAESALAQVKKGSEEVKELVSTPTSQWKCLVLEKAKAISPGWAKELGAEACVWWTRERVHKAAEGSLPNRKLDALAIEALCGLVCASLTEDRYGVVQRDIPRILEALLSFLSAIEEYQAEIVSRHPIPSAEELGNMNPKEAALHEEVAFDVSKAGDVLNEVSGALKEGIVQIVRTFGDKLTAFKFPPRTAQKLQGFVDYN